MKKFVLYTESFQFNANKFKSVEDAYNNLSDYNNKPVAFFDDAEEALNALEQFNVFTRKYDWKSARATVAFVAEENGEFDEDGKWQFGDGDWCSGLKCEPLADEDDEDDE